MLQWSSFKIIIINLPFIYFLYIILFTIWTVKQANFCTNQKQLFIMC